MYGNLQGTSMAAPAAAAVAALIWSAHPNFTDEEVLQRLYNSADEIDSKNFWYRGKLGHGRINAENAVK
jgi:subtilisin family serine protease